MVADRLAALMIADADVVPAIHVVRMVHADAIHAGRMVHADAIHAGRVVRAGHAAAVPAGVAAGHAVAG